MDSAVTQETGEFNLYWHLLCVSTSKSNQSNIKLASKVQLSNLAEFLTSPPDLCLTLSITDPSEVASCYRTIQFVSKTVPLTVLWQF